MKLVSEKSNAKTYGWMLCGGLALLAIVNIPLYAGYFNGADSQWNGLLLWLFVGVPGFILGLVGLVGLQAEVTTWEIVILKGTK